MAYWKDKWIFPNSIEYEYKFAGKYGAKGEKRAKKEKITPEQIKKQNQRNRETKMRRLIKANFIENDLWVTLKYPKGTRKPIEKVKEDLKKFTTNVRREYKKRGESFKFIYRMEIGKHGGIHIHILVNRLGGKPDTDIILQNKWGNGRIHFESIYEYGGYEKLANYIVKQPDEQQEEQLSFFDENQKKELIKYSSSRNLVRPAPERTMYTRRTVKKIIEEGPLPSKGYYVDKNSIRSGVNQYTGMSYLYYTEVKIKHIYEKREGGG